MTHQWHSGERGDGASPMLDVSGNPVERNRVYLQKIINKF